MKRYYRKLSTFVIFVCLVLMSTQGTGGSQKQAMDYGEQLSINLKSKALVTGPVIKLGDLGSVIMPDSVRGAEVAELKIADAPPPGESSEISLNYVKRRLQAAGLKDLTAFVHGPSIIRVTTAPEEIDKAFIKEEYAVLASFNVPENIL